LTEKNNQTQQGTDQKTERATRVQMTRTNASRGLVTKIPGQD